MKVILGENHRFASASKPIGVCRLERTGPSRNRLANSALVILSRWGGLVQAFPTAMLAAHHTGQSTLATHDS